jgi:UDP-N-acetylglucosamine 2-epimerase (non-hydrolysing)/UDP-GlcNAc3NAcA epimerase
MPEELNRVLTDHLSELLLCSSQGAAENLRAESVTGRVEVVGDVMVDVALRWQPAARTDTAIPGAYGLKPGSYFLLTAHRAGNVDDPRRLCALVKLIERLPGPADAVPPASAHPHAAEGRRAIGTPGRRRRPEAD